MTGRFGPIELLLLGFIFVLMPIFVFILGFYFGKKSGYIKRVKEEDLKK